MPLIEDILACRSVSIVGTEKNTGKTECLNYILRHLPAADIPTAVTSIGVDGERTDALTGGSKPEIVLPEGMFFATSEKHYGQRHIVSEVLDVGEELTALGRVVTARSLFRGRAMISGPSTAASLHRWIDRMPRLGVRLVLVDGALSRLSSASPAVTEAMVLATGAALSMNLDHLVRQTAHTVTLIGLPAASPEAATAFAQAPGGIRFLSADGTVHDTGLSSALGLPADGSLFGPDCRAVYVGGALTDRFAAALRTAAQTEGLEVVVPDFTRVFLSPAVLRSLADSGVRLTVLERSRLLAVCVNPVAPNGYQLDSEHLCRVLAETIGCPVYDIMRCKDAA